jgi:hypothetical protein
MAKNKDDVKMWAGPPYSYTVLMNGKWIEMSGFDEEHIRNQLHPKKAKKIKRKR